MNYDFSAFSFETKKNREKLLIGLVFEHGDAKVLYAYLQTTFFIFSSFHRH
jgi:hypothetical protein